MPPLLAVLLTYWRQDELDIKGYILQWGMEDAKPSKVASVVLHSPHAMTSTDAGDAAAPVRGKLHRAERYARDKLP